MKYMVVPNPAMDPRTERRYGPEVEEAPLAPQILISDKDLRQALQSFSGVSQQKTGLVIQTKTMTRHQFYGMIDELDAQNLQNISAYILKTKKKGARGIFLPK